MDLKMVFKMIFRDNLLPRLSACLLLAGLYDCHPFVVGNTQQLEGELAGIVDRDSQRERELTYIYIFCLSLINNPGSPFAIDIYTKTLPEIHILASHYSYIYFSHALCY